jgi:OFA family oxalate/formate antiporter-like MFS transporter
MQEQDSNRGVPNRWIIAVAATVLQIALGAVYAWSVFRIPLVRAFHWTISEVTLAFTIAIFTLGLASFLGGLWMRKAGPRVVAMTGGLLYGLGVFLASFSNHGLWVLYLTYGVIGGAGLGLGYIVPISTLVKWFPDRRGFITGVAVAGFGAGALVTAPVATRLILQVGVLRTFAMLGIAYLVLVVVAGWFMVDPPAGYAPAGWSPAADQKARAREYSLHEALHTWQWYALWALLFLNVCAGISIISQAAPMAQEITGANATKAAAMVGIISIANGAGRFIWAWLSDFIGRRWVFLSMFLLQAVVFFFLTSANTYSVFTLLAFVVLLCYGGGFGTMPAFAADYFGPRDVGPIYGLMLTAWGFGSAVGPLLIATIRERTGQYTDALYILAGVMLVSAVIPFLVHPPVEQGEQGFVPQRPRPSH